MYKKTNFIGADGSQQVSYMRTNEDGSFTVFNENAENSEYIAYLKWIEEGNVPTPADE
jgi:hypothetical protein